jgi:hypothetical protein
MIKYIPLQIEKAVSRLESNLYSRGYCKKKRPIGEY